jgi:hypothetical protein
MYLLALGKMYRARPLPHQMLVDIDHKGVNPMLRRFIEAVGVRRTGWAALDRDPQQDKVEFVCPHCGTHDQKNARRERSLYHFTDGFLQDLQGEVTQCHTCKRSVRVVPVVLLHDQGEIRRFEAIFADQQQSEPPVQTDAHPAETSSLHATESLVATH